MSVRAARMGEEYAAVAARVGRTEAEIHQEMREYAQEGRDVWLAWDVSDVVGVLVPWLAPDGRNRLYFEACRADAYGSLASAIAGPCFATVDREDADAIRALHDGGFVESRSENVYGIPMSQVDAPAPGGLRIIRADETELELLMLLDCALRADIPGAQGWQPDPGWFRAETYDSPSFDPRSYTVALDGDTYVGLCRIWRDDPAPRRLGMVGVLPPYRRRGLGRALIAAAMAPIVGEVAHVVAEADVANAASHALLTSFGARVTGGSTELFRSR